MLKMLKQQLRNCVIFNKCLHKYSTTKTFVQSKFMRVHSLQKLRARTHAHSLEGTWPLIRRTCSVLHIHLISFTKSADEKSKRDFDDSLITLRCVLPRFSLKLRTFDARQLDSVQRVLHYMTPHSHTVVYARGEFWV